MAIKPKYVKMLLSGTKSVEIRRRNVRLPPGTRIWFYATSPWHQIVATATVQAVRCASPEEVWRQSGDRVGIDRPEFDAYVGGRDSISAIALVDVRRLRSPLPLQNAECNFRPPQSYAHLRPRTPLLAILQARERLSLHADAPAASG